MSPATSAWGMFITVSHSFRMELFFLLAGFFSHMTIGRKGWVDFLRSRFVRIAIPFVIGWMLLRPLIVAGFIAGGESRRGDYNVWSSLVSGFWMTVRTPAEYLTGTHLWFLYYLLMITGLVAGGSFLLSLHRPSAAWLRRVADQDHRMVGRIDLGHPRGGAASIRPAALHGQLGRRYSGQGLGAALARAAALRRVLCRWLAAGPASGKCCRSSPGSPGSGPASPCWPWRSWPS